MKCAWFFAAVLIVIGCSSSSVLLQPNLMPSSGTEDEMALIQQGINLHDEGKYDQAIVLYNQVLQRNPHHVIAMSEIAYSYFAKGDFQKSLDWGLKASQYDSPALSHIYMIIGNSYDNMGKGDLAIKVFEDAIKKFPEEQLLHYNLALAYYRKKRLDDAIVSLKKSVQLRPTHASSHMLLGQCWYSAGYTIPAMLAFSAFLVYEPYTERANQARQNLGEIMGRFVTAKDSKNINISIDAHSRDEEGDFKGIELMLALARSMSIAAKIDSNKADSELIIKEYETILTMMGENPKEPHTGFAWKFYGTFFAELHRQGHTRTYCCHMMTENKDDNVKKWLADHPSEYRAFLEWVKNYQWATD
ncbi:tetratricopeptide repeat protein [bacterium]|nr:tetratricopeptide repeat protein [bacterium]